MPASPRHLHLAAVAFVVLSSSTCTDRAPTEAAPYDPGPAAGVTADPLSPTEALGRAIFFDRNLSLHGNQSCAACHAPEYGFTGPNPGINQQGSVYLGSVRTRAGGRKPPSAAYATFSPILHFDAAEEVWIGGNFWDGRATGLRLGNPAADQALGPFLNPVEQALPDPICVLYGIATGDYADLWQVVWGNDLRDLAWPVRLDRDCRAEAPISYPAGLAAAVSVNYDRVGLSIMSYEASTEVNPFTSKYDAWIAGLTPLTAEEELGRQLFEGKAMCSACHPSDGAGALFTDFTYDNLGVPPNPLNPVYEVDPTFVDRGLGGILGDPTLYGAVKVPTLRNVARAPGYAPKAFGHNGVFKSLEQIIHFYNTRDVLPACLPGQIAPTPGGLAMMGYAPACWPAPEVAQNVNVDELGDLGLSLEEERAIVAFLRTLTDGWIR